MSDQIRAAAEAMLARAYSDGVEDTIRWLERTDFFDPDDGAYIRHALLKGPDPRPPEPAEPVETEETEDARHRRIAAWFCTEPGCDVLGRGHEGAHRKSICLEDVTTVEWTEPGRYLAALRSLAAPAPRLNLCTARCVENGYPAIECPEHGDIESMVRYLPDQVAEVARRAYMAGIKRASVVRGPGEEG